MSLNYQATRFTCSWPWTTAVLLCDGRVVCGCADPYAKRVLGDVRRSSLREVWNGDPMASLRQDINGGGSGFCGDCPLKLPLAPDQAAPTRPSPGPLPARLYVECTAACNISCFQACCAPETGITRTRQAGMLDFDLFTRVIDEAGPSLGRIDFFNYGETFLHKRAVEMCEYIKSRFPSIYLYTSTNGLAFNEDGARRLVRSGIDEVTFSIDGATPATYARYRQRGDFDKAIRFLRLMAEEKRAAGLDVPVLNWRYILFTWNDSDEEMNLARSMATDIGVDRLCWEITDHPEDSFSRRFAPGTPLHASIQHEIWDDNNLGNAIPGAMPRARIRVAGARAEDFLGYVARWLPRAPLMGRASHPLRIRTNVLNLSTRAFPATASYGRRLVRLGAQLCAQDGTLLNRDYARAWLPDTLVGGASAEVPIEIVPPEQPGRYLLKFDLVSEGIDWFEACGSETTTAALWVR
jgi:MoaA/NifB/PqqE/SkfB family radical SAM enzyme